MEDKIGTSVPRLFVARFLVMALLPVILMSTPAEASHDQPRAGINHPDDELTAVNTAFDGQMRDLPCPKWTEETQANAELDWNKRTLGEKVQEITNATAKIDSRRKWREFPEPGRVVTETAILDKSANNGRAVEYWRESGHFGLYTCNWLAAGTVYRIEVSGTYTHRLDGLVTSTTYANSDAECSTGSTGQVL